MFNLTIFVTNRSNGFKVLRTLASAAESIKSEETDNFRVLNLKNVKTLPPRKKRQPLEVLPPRADKMKPNQDWGTVWPGPRTFHPATVPLPLRQGYPIKGSPPPNKYGNAELMKIPNFLHLTPPVIERQCKALKQFCTPWPKNLDTDEKCEKHFPLEVASSNYCHSSPSIRDPLSRVVTVQLKLSALNLDSHARDKYLRLVGDRYNPETDIVTIVTDRCPLRKQNYDYAMYLLTALSHESWKIEPWEELKTDDDMEYYDWQKSKSKCNIDKLLGKNSENNNEVKEYSLSLDALMNNGESDESMENYGLSVRKMLNVPVLN